MLLILLAYSTDRVMINFNPGSRDGTLHVWNINTGSIITMFDMHVAVVHMFITGDAGHVIVRLGCSKYVPLMCPAQQSSRRDQVSESDRYRNERR